MAQLRAPSQGLERNSRSTFDGFTPIGSQMYYHDRADNNISWTTYATKDSAEHPAPASSPDLVILCTWMGAATKHISKYTTAYLDRFPNVNVLLLRSSVMDLTLRPLNWQINRMSPAVKLIRTMRSRDDESGRKLHVLVHNFSNGGSWSAIVLAQAYKAETGAQLPVHALISDSAPSLPSAKRAVSAMSQTLGNSILIRIVGLTAIWSIIIITYILNRLRITENLLYKLRGTLNDSSGPFLGPRIPRLYICSQTDAMVPMHDVETHASEARMILQRQHISNIGDLISVEEFHKSNHVGHMMVDRERYWSLVQATWDKVQP